jgi:hypothetical protein
MYITVKDIIEHLRQFPPDMEVWETWDESGQYWSATELLGRIDHVELRTRHGKQRWVQTDDKGKPVLVLLAPDKVL